MHIDLTSEALLSQLGYTKTEHTIEQMEETINNTNGFNNFSKHLLSLHDNLAHLKGFIALSNSRNVFKIKCSEDVPKETQEEFNSVVTHWADKHKINIEKVHNKPTYYILGQ